LTAIIGGDLEYSRRSSPSSILADAGLPRAQSRPAGPRGWQTVPTPGGIGTRTQEMPALLNIDGLKLKASE
jgi:hypothetical protein